MTLNLGRSNSLVSIVGRLKHLGYRLTRGRWPRNIVSGATIKSDGSVRPEVPGDQVIELFLVESAAGPFWFEETREYAENGNDRWVTIRNLGLRNKDAGGSRTSIFNFSFSTAEARTAEEVVRRFFMGSRSAAPYKPSPGAKGRCLDVIFPAGWITVLNPPRTERGLIRLSA